MPRDLNGKVIVITGASSGIGAATAVECATAGMNVLLTARLAGIGAAKRTDEWIPLCHSLPLDGIDIELTPDPAESCIFIEARVETHAKTGVEMEALVAVSAAGLTIYDMCKAIDRGISIGEIRLLSKTGGKSGSWLRPGESNGPADAPTE